MWRWLNDGRWSWTRLCKRYRQSSTFYWSVWSSGWSSYHNNMIIIQDSRSAMESVDTEAYQRAAGLSGLLVGLRHHGRDAVQRTVLQLRGQRAESHQHWHRSRQGDLSQTGARFQLFMDQPNGQLRQRPRCLPGSLSSGIQNIKLTSTATIVV